MQAIDTIPLDDIEVVYFDVDGVLSIPRYPIGPNGAMISFADQASWCIFADNNLDAYKDCYIPTAIIAWMQKLKAAGIPINILSASNDSEEKAKLKFLREKYGDLIDEITLVDSPEHKVRHMRWQQEKHGYQPFKMLLVEDYAPTLYDAFISGFRGIHVAWFLDCTQ